MSNESDSYETHDVKIEDVKPLDKHIDVVFKVHEREEEREINTRSGETHRVCDITVADETGSIVLTLWNEDIDNIENDKTYKLSNGFVNVYQNSLRLSKGKYGTITEESTVLDEINSENNRSSEHVEDPRRQSYGNRSYGNRSSGGYGNRSSGGYGNRSSSSYGDRRRQDRSSGKRNRW
jgi:replication factor A1